MANVPPVPASTLTATTGMRHSRKRKLPAQLVFFPAAALHTALVLPLSVLMMTTDIISVPGLAYGHGGEMLFGFALALVAGYLLGPLSLPRLLLLFGLWLAARLAALGFTTPALPMLLNTGFALILAAHIVPKLSAAKKWRNRIIGPLLLSLMLLPAITLLALRYPGLDMFTVMQLALILFALLMAFMGGRIIAPAVAGAFYRQNERLAARVQPRLEAALIVLFAAAALAVLLPDGNLPAGLLLIAAAVVIAVRLYRWQVWHCHGYQDLKCLVIGYGWLAVGTLLTGISLILETGISNAWHVLTVGALGTLSITVMARAHQARARQSDNLYIMAVMIATAAIAVATVLRGLTGLIPVDAVILLWLATACWSLAYLTYVALLVSASLPRLARRDSAQHVRQNT